MESEEWIRRIERIRRLAGRGQQEAPAEQVVEIGQDGLEVALLCRADVRHEAIAKACPPPGSTQRLPGGALGSTAPMEYSSNSPTWWPNSWAATSSWRSLVATLSMHHRDIWLEQLGVGSTRVL